MNSIAQSVKLVPPLPGEFAGYLLAVGARHEARTLQAQQVLAGRRAALSGARFNEARPAAWQVGYAEALGDIERGPLGGYHG